MNTIEPLLKGISDTRLVDAVKHWFSLPLSTHLRFETLRLLEEGDIQELSRRFLSSLSFGTAGIRAPMGEGFGYLNEYTIAQITWGLSNFLQQEKGNKVALLGYDSRHNSLLFAHIAAKTLLLQGFSVCMFSIPTPIPILAYATSFYQACVGIMITASHNPKQDNGYKIFNPNGGQFSPSQTQHIAEHIHSSQNIPFKEIQDTSLDTLTSPDVQMLLAYFQSVKSQIPNFHSLAEYVSIVYSPLMGSGKYYAQEMIKFLGGELRIVEEENKYDGNFLTFASPNPEDPETFRNAIELAKQVNSPICVVTDPDADRIGVWEKGRYFNGNDIGILVAFFLLEHQPQKRHKCLLSSIVSTQLLQYIASYWNCAYKQIPTGFKYIGAAIEQDPENFLFGFEESGGYLIGPYIQDKDAIGTLGLLFTITNYLYSRGKTISSYLEDIHETVGYSQTQSVEISLPQGIISEFLEELKDQHVEIFGKKVLEDEDFLSYKKFRGGKEVSFPDMWSSFPPLHLRIFYLESYLRLAIRPSGTESKLKCYIELLIPPSKNISKTDKLKCLENFYDLKSRIKRMDSF